LRYRCVVLCGVVFMYPIHHVGIYSSDFNRSEEFYAKLGFQRTRTMQVGERKFIFLKNGSAGIELFQPRTENDDTPKQGAPGFRHVCFLSDDVKGDYERLRDSVEFIKPPFRHEDVLITFCLDPDGVEVELLQQMQCPSR